MTSHASGTGFGDRDAASGFYVTGGALSLDATSYVPRRADEELLAALQAGEFCYVLTSRQRGKSSLMIRTAQRLRLAGVRVALLDLARLGQNLSPAQWYLGLLDLLGELLGLHEELEHYWDEHQKAGPMRVWFNSLTDVALTAAPSPIVIFVDEIDCVRSLSFSTDEFFAGVRECYNRRSQDSRLSRLSFCLLGVASPADLVRDPRITPFNVGRRIELTDFSTEEARPLAAFLHPDRAVQMLLLKRVLYWTNGHPYLTQRLCASLFHRSASRAAEVDGVCRELFLVPEARKRDDNILFVAQQLLRSDIDRAALFDLYRRVHRGKSVRDDPTNPLVEALRLSGITRSDAGLLAVRNHIYQKSFDRKWISQNLPEAELRRQRSAFHRGIGGGLIIAIFIASILFLAKARLHENREQFIRDHLGDIYAHLDSYSDSAVIKAESGLLSLGATNNFVFARPNRFRLDASINFIVKEVRVDACCDGKSLWVYIPALGQYLQKAAPENVMDLVNQGSRTEPMNDLLRYAFRIYEMVLSTNAHRLLVDKIDKKSLKVSSPRAESDLYLISWSEACTVVVPQRDKKFIHHGAIVNARGWLRDPDGVFVKTEMDLSSFKESLASSEIMSVAFPGTNITATAEHSNIKIDPDVSRVDFAFHPPPEATPVARLDLMKLIPGLANPQPTDP
ncbi:MAG: AAA-like domain-containing protein [Verrucomicrobiota bacterium]|jgi:outer membrane lipoprotein-sorting protein